MRVDRGEDFDEFFRSSYPALVRAASRVAGNRHLGEEAAIEAMTKAFVRWRRVGSLSYRDAWVVRVAINEAFRSMRRESRKGLLAPAGPVERDYANDVATRVSVAAAVAGLPRRQRDAISLCYVSDLGEADTAAALGVSLGALKSHLARGRRALRASLGEELARELLRADA